MEVMLANVKRSLHGKIIVSPGSRLNGDGTVSDQITSQEMILGFVAFNRATPKRGISYYIVKWDATIALCLEKASRLLALHLARVEKDPRPVEVSEQI